VTTIFAAAEKRELVSNGASAHQFKAIFGWRTLKQVYMRVLNRLPKVQCPCRSLERRVAKDVTTSAQGQTFFRRTLVMGPVMGPIMGPVMR